MKNISAIACCITILFFALLLTISANAQTNDKYTELAHRIVQTSARIKPGEVVIVSGGKHLSPLMEEIAIEVFKAGGHARMLLRSDRVSRAIFAEIPEQYLEQEPRFWGEWLRNTNVMIELPRYENPKAVFDGVSDVRRAKLTKANQFLNELLNPLSLRAVRINYPTKEEAAQFKVDFAAFEQMQIEAIKADYQSIYATGQKIQKLFEGAKKMRVTTPNGTDLSFSIGNPTTFLRDGIVTEEEAKEKRFESRVSYLPGGAFEFIPVETSANGKMVVSKDYCEDFLPLINQSFEFKDGQLQNYKVEKNEDCFKKLAAIDDNAIKFSYISIGLNSALKPIEENDALYSPAAAAGMVHVGIGNNTFLNGNNKSKGAFAFPLSQATVEIDGRTIVKNGQIILQ